MTIRDENTNKGEIAEEHPWKFSPNLVSSNISESEPNQQVLHQLRLRQVLLEKQKIELADARQELQNLRSSNKELRHIHSVLTGVSPDAIIATDKNLNITEWNPAAEQLFGWKTNEVIGQDASPDIRSNIMTVLKKEEVFNGLAAQGYWIGKLAGDRRNGQPLSVQVSVGVLWDHAGAFNGLVAIFRETI